MSYPKIRVTPPGPKAKKLVERDAAVISPSFGRAYPLVVESAEGSIVKDVDGNEFIDFTMGHGSLLMGHGHPAILEAVEAQLSRGTHLGGCHPLEV